MKITNAIEARDYLVNWYAENTPASSPVPSILLSQTIPSYGVGWNFVVRWPGSVSVIRVGPRGARDQLVHLTTEQVEELR